MVSFADIEKQIPGDEFDLVAVVANCGTMKYLRERKQKISRGYSHRRQAAKLMNWAKDNKQMLIEYTLKSTSKSRSTLNVAPFEDEIVPISSIPSQSTAHSFYVEGEISLPSEFQFFFVLLCSECQHLARIKRKKKVLCINCKLERMLIPRCEFEVDITDGSGTITAVVSNKLAERMLSLTADQIYETAIVKKQVLPVEHIRKHLLDEMFKIHLQKSLLRTPDRPPCTFVISSYTQKQIVFDLAQSLTSATIVEGSKRKLESISTSEEADRRPLTQDENPKKKPNVQCDATYAENWLQKRKLVRLQEPQKRLWDRICEGSGAAISSHMRFWVALMKTAKAIQVLARMCELGSTDTARNEE
uniref:Uncharacterized protein LOC104240972 n=1 Tax=Nicotiana sylvestris TaxID=4096 RepID=A0A1U7XQ23_NICSY|nr:PREDICTED: uncharacterized protein LOC104240972 [Nicotiana sylvestris]